MGDPPAVTGQRLPHAAAAQVPCQPAAVVADGRQRAPVGAERQLLHPAVVTIRQPPALPRAEVQKRDAAVLAAEGGTAAVEGQAGGERPAREPPPHAERCRVHHVRRVLGGPGEDEAVTPCPDDGRGRVRPADAQDPPELPPGAHVEAKDVGGVRRSSRRREERRHQHGLSAGREPDVGEAESLARARVGEPDVAHGASGRRVDQPHDLTSAADAGVGGQQLAVRREVEAHDGAVHLDRTADPPARPRVEAQERPALAAGGEHPPVGAHRQRVERVPAALHHAERAGRADERRQEMAAGDRSVVELAAGLGEQEAPVEPVVDQRLSAEPLCVGGPQGVARVAALPEREHAGDGRGHEQHPGGGEQGAQAAVGPQLRPALALGLGDARVEERPLGRVQRVLAPLRPFECGAEPGAAVEVRGIAPRGLPDARGVTEPPVQAQALAVLLEPAPQGRPLADQHLVRDLGGPLAEGRRAGRRQSGPAGRGPHRPRRPGGRARRSAHGAACPRRRRRAPSAEGRRCAAASALRLGVESTSASADCATAEVTPPLAR